MHTTGSVVLFISSIQQLVCVRPNIVVLIASDLGWNDVGFHGSDEIPTPNIDALAYNGLILNKHYVQQLGSATKSAILTGLYPINTGMQGPAITDSEPNGLPVTFKILPQFLKELDYSTHMIGKWDQGFFKEDYLPLQRGFDSFFGFFTSYIGYYDYMTSYERDEIFYKGLAIKRNRTAAWDVVGSYSTDLFTSESVKVIKSQPKSKPLFLMLSYNAVRIGSKGHKLEAPQDRINLFNYILDPNRRIYAAMVSKLDESVGNITVALGEAGILDNTIILFLSDNGAPASAIDNLHNWGSNLPFRGTRDTLWEGGVRSVSFIWSTQIKSCPKVSAQLIHASDWLPTLYSAAGCVLSDDCRGNLVNLPPKIDGHNQWNALILELPSKRKTIVLNIDDRRRQLGFIYEETNVTTWKLLFGTFRAGRYDGYFNTVQKVNPPYNATQVVNSQTHRYTNSRLFKPRSKEFLMLMLRNEATITCHSAVGVKRGALKCKEHPCLFDLVRDPCEQKDIAKDNLNTVNKMVGSIGFYRHRALPQINTVEDSINSDPSNFNNTFTTWQ